MRVDDIIIKRYIIISQWNYFIRFTAFCLSFHFVFETCRGWIQASQFISNSGRPWFLGPWCSLVWALGRLFQNNPLIILCLCSNNIVDWLPQTVIARYIIVTSLSKHVSNNNTIFNWFLYALNYFNLFNKSKPQRYGLTNEVENYVILKKRVHSCKSNFLYRQEYKLNCFNQNYNIVKAMKIIKSISYETVSRLKVLIFLFSTVLSKNDKDIAYNSYSFKI